MSEHGQKALNSHLSMVVEEGSTHTIPPTFVQTSTVTIPHLRPDRAHHSMRMKRKELLFEISSVILHFPHSNFTSPS